MAMTKFGEMPGGGDVWLLELSAGGVCVELISYGATLHRVLAPDRDGNIADVILGRDDLEGYMSPGAPSGAVIGRVANRIKNGAFTLNGKRHRLESNERRFIIHGGAGNYARKNFAVMEATDRLARFALRDVGEAGFPGEISVEVCYSLDDSGTLLIEYSAVPTRDTPLNLTNHVYFNLAGQDSGPVYDQTIKINADYYTPSDRNNITTGEIYSVKNSPYDLTRPRMLGEAIEELDEAGGIWNGFDINFVLKGEGWRKIAEAYDEDSGRALEAYTDLPGVQLFTMNYVRDGAPGKDGATYGAHYGFCLETQFFPDSINKPHFPGGIAYADELFTTTTAYRFFVK